MKLTKKRTVLLSIIIVCVLAGSGGAYYALTNNSKQNDNQETKAEVSPPQSNEESKLTSIAADPLKHVDEETSVRGVVRMSPDGKYIIMAENPQPDQPAGMVVDFQTNSIDPAQYVDSDTAVTVKGKSVKTETAERLTVIFVVSSINP